MRNLGMAILAVLFGFGCAHQSETSNARLESSLDEFLPRWEQAQTNFLNGDATLWKQLCSQTPDASIFGAFGGYESGWEIVEERYEWAASQYRPSGAIKNVEYLSKGISGNLAFTVGIERDTPQTLSQDSPTPRALRVTQVFRFEDGDWRLLHRHADPLVEKTTP